MANAAPQLPQLAAQIKEAIRTIPDRYRDAPIDGSVVVDPEAAFTHIQHWAFINGYAYVTESKGKRRVRYECIMYFPLSNWPKDSKDSKTLRGGSNPNRYAYTWDELPCSDTGQQVQEER